jgi:hypothetical protein
MKKTPLIIIAILIWQILSANESKVILNLPDNGFILQDDDNEQNKKLAGDSNFSFSAIEDLKEIANQDKDSQYKWIKHSGKKLITKQTLLKTMGEKAYLLATEKESIIYPQSQVAVNPDGKIHLLTGKIISFPYSSKKKQ